MLTEYDIKEFFISHRETIFEKQIWESRAYQNAASGLEDKQRVENLDLQIKMVDSMLDLLSENEAFVIKRHLLNGLDWAQVAIEYKEKWGEEMEKSIRALQIYQAKALQKIARVANRRTVSLLDIKDC